MLCNDLLRSLQKNDTKQDPLKDLLDKSYLARLYELSYKEMSKELTDIKDSANAHDVAQKMLFRI